MITEDTEQQTQRDWLRRQPDDKTEGTSALLQWDNSRAEIWEV